MRVVRLALVSLSVLASAACASRARQVPMRTLDQPPPMLPHGYALYRADSGRPIPLPELAAMAAGADLVALGELHDHPEGSRAEREIYEAISSRGRPVALAMEFFERDTQADVDAWLAGTLDDEAFRKRTKRAPTYEETHGPLLALARARGLPVIAANAPRRLVSAWRKAETTDYFRWRASQPEADRALLPRTTWMTNDDYRTRFADLMGSRSDAFFRSQSLWDDAMAEAASDFRFTHPHHRVLFVVGGFHVQGRLGSVTKYRARRPGDRVLVIVMSATDSPGLPLDAEDRGQGDVILVVPHHEPPAPTGPNPHARPKPAQPAAPAAPVIPPPTT